MADQDTQPMTLGELDLDDWPTEKIPRTGARHRTPRTTLAGWALFGVLAGAALGGGAWFAATANSNLAPSDTTTAPAITTPTAQQGGLVVIPTTSTTSSGPHTDARPGRATSSAPRTTPPHTQAPMPPRDTGTPTTEISSSPSHSPSLPPTPTSTVPDPNNPYCVTINYSDGTSIASCSPSPSTPDPDASFVGP